MISGFMNVTGNMASGLHFSGVANITGQSFGGLMASGLLNVVGEHMNGLQIAGIANITASKLNGVQIACSIMQLRNENARTSNWSCQLLQRRYERFPTWFGKCKS